MKKIALTILAAALFFLCCSCGGKKAKPAAERLEKGEEVLACIALSSATNPALYTQAKTVRDNFEAMGVTVDLAVANGDDTVMISQIEKFIEKEADIIVCAAARPSVLEEVLFKARNAKIPVILTDGSPTYLQELSGAFTTQWYQMGGELMQMAGAWADAAEPGGYEIHAAVFGDAGESFEELGAGILERAQAGGRIRITFNGTGVQTPEEGQAAARAALAYDPEIRIFICYQEAVSIGVSQYILSEEELEPSRYACFSPDNPAVGADEIERSRINESVLRGVISSGVFRDKKIVDSDFAAFAIAREILLDRAPALPFLITGDRRAVTGFGYDYLYENPQNDSIISAVSAK